MNINISKTGTFVSPRVLTNAQKISGMYAPTCDIVFKPAASNNVEAGGTVDATAIGGSIALEDTICGTCRSGISRLIFVPFF